MAIVSIQSIVVIQNYLKSEQSERGTHGLPFTAVVSIMLVGGSALLILYELRKMMKTVINDDCFVQENVTSLVRMSIYAFVITGLKLLRCFVYFTPAALIVAGVFFFAGLFSKVLSLVFDRAVQYKLENDLTI